VRCDQQHGSSRPNLPPWALWVFIPVALVALFWVGSLLASQSTAVDVEPTAVEPASPFDEATGCEDPCSHVCNDACPAVCEPKQACEVLLGGTCGE
jgi:hypothetical protein